MCGVAYIARLIKFASHNPQRMLKIPELRKFQIDGEKKSSAEQKKNKPLRSANVTINPADKIIQLMHPLVFQMR